MIKPLISLITVCRNGEDVIKETIESVINQKEINFEYIIIDGLSSDSTVSIIKEYANEFPIHWTSEKDEGIYDAMNKGCKIACGEWVYFLNAGDILYDNCILHRVANQLVNNNIIYGSIIYKYPDGKSQVRKYGKLCGKQIYFCTGDCINHQAIFVPRNLLLQNPFNKEYRICADREWMMRMMKKSINFKCINEIIAYYSLDVNSMSISNKDIYLEEAKKCMKQYYFFNYYIFCFFQFLRDSKILSAFLHSIYKLLYLRKVN